jgi:penicillin-binding protein 1A
LSLGILDVTPTEMARAYAGFANRGSLPEVMPLRYITDSEGNCLKEYRRTKADCGEDDQDLPDFEQVVKQNSADVLNEVLTHVTSEGTATAAALPGWEVSGKTGTTQENVDAWFAGSVPQLTTVVWMGYPAEKRPIVDPTGTELKKKELFVPQMGYCGDPELCRPVQGIEVTGGSFPARIWNSYMTVATAEMEPEFWPTPADLPDEILNEPDAPVGPAPSAAPSPSASAKPSPSPEPEPSIEPTPTPDPSPDPSPNPTPTPLPSPQERPNRPPEQRGSSP